MHFIFSHKKNIYFQTVENGLSERGPWSHTQSKLCVDLFLFQIYIPKLRKEPHQRPKGLTNVILYAVCIIAFIIFKFKNGYSFYFYI